MTEITLDAKHTAIRDGDQWQVSRLHPSGQYRTVANWTGNRRSILQWCEDNDVHPTRQAESILASLPERTAFAPDRD